MPPPYAPSPRCIYCGSAEPRGKEHIIPEGLGGKLVIPTASCRRHERITSRLESACIDSLFVSARPHFDIKGRRQIGPYHLIRTRLASDSAFHERRVPLHEHPGHLVAIAYDHAPGILVGLNSYENTMVNVGVVGAVPDFLRRTARLGGKLHLFRKTFNVETFALMLAKIAHAYTVAEKGYDGFAPLLIPFIEGKEPGRALHYVGGDGPRPEPANRELHQIGFYSHPFDLDDRYWVVRIRLFSKLPTPTYYVVSGLRS